jgi:hypothetical protein
MISPTAKEGTPITDKIMTKEDTEIIVMREGDMKATKGERITGKNTKVQERTRGQKEEKTQ